jgi:hypothetical protein
MNKIELIISYGNLKDNDVIPFTEKVLQNLTGNTLFTVTKERIDTVRTHLTDYQTKLGRNKDGSKQDTLNKNESKVVLISLLDDLALDLCVQANGDRTKLATTGFTLVKDVDKKAKQPTKPVSFKVEHGTNPGELLFSVAPNKDARIYIFYFTAAPATQADPTLWRSVASTNRKMLVNGFTHGVEYDCRCAYQGSDQKPIFGDAIRILAQ